MNCPICIASIQTVGFDYHPPLEYFDKVFAGLSKLNPRPFVDLYGGEPTVRADLVDVIKLARRHKLKVRLVTNGLKLADEAYCKKICDVRVPMRLSFDGLNPETYLKLRGDASVLQTKLQALANIKKFSHRKHSILTCLGKDTDIASVFNLCHDYGTVIDQLGIIPLKEDWHMGPERLEHPQMTPEDVENAVKSAVPDGQVNFISAGLVHCLALTRSFFTERKISKNFMFAGSHPNCESMTFLVSDGQKYRSINHYLKIPLDTLAEEVIRRGQKLNERLSTLNPKKFLHRWLGRLLTLKTFLPVALRAINFHAIFRGNPCLAILKTLIAPLNGQRIWDALRQVTSIPYFLRVGVLPFEEYLAVDAQRLANCKGLFAYEDVQDGQIKFIPVCTWFLYRKAILKTIADKYGVAPTKISQAAPSLPTDTPPKIKTAS
jgi:uncharacterized radical SAM superfamily Fe-S cluster-containing enzyme